MKKSDLFYIVLGAFFWVIGQYFALRFFSFEDFLIRYIILKFVNTILNFLFISIFAIGIIIFLINLIKKTGRSNKLIELINNTKKEIDNIFQQKIQRHFWFSLPENYKIGTKNLKDTYKILWAFSAFFVYFFLNAALNLYSTGKFSFKFILSLIFLFLSIYIFFWFSFVTLLAFSSYILRGIIKLIEYDILQLIRLEIKNFIIKIYPYIRHPIKVSTMIINVILFILIPIIVLLSILGKILNIKIYEEIIAVLIANSKYVNYFIAYLVLFTAFIVIWSYIIKPNELISSFLKIIKTRINNFDENTNLEERYKTIKYFEYCIDFFPHSSGYYVLPAGLRLGFYSTFSKMHTVIIRKLSRKMEHVKTQFEELAFKIRYSKNTDEFLNISNELDQLIDVFQNEKYESIQEEEYEPYSLFRKFSIKTNELPGALILLVLTFVVQLLLSYTVDDIKSFIFNYMK